MRTWELFVIAIGLSMDAFATSVCKGLTVKKTTYKELLITGLWFGGFQALMPSIGYLLGSGFQELIANIDHWIAFTLLVIIGINMIREAFAPDEEEASSFSIKAMFPLAVATSIDALAVGVTFAFLKVNIVAAASFIGATTFIISAIGVKIGSVFGSRFRKPSEILGGVILILMGLKILLEHLGYLG